MSTSSFLFNPHTKFYFFFHFWHLKWTLQLQHSSGWKPGTDPSFIIQEELTLVCIPTFQKDLRLSCKFYIPPSSGSVIWGPRVQSPSYSTVHLWSEISGNSPVGDNPWEKHGDPAPEADQQVGGWTLGCRAGGRCVRRRLSAVGGNQGVGLPASREEEKSPYIWRETYWARTVLLHYDSILALGWNQHGNNTGSCLLNAYSEPLTE